MGSGFCFSQLAPILGKVRATHSRPSFIADLVSAHGGREAVGDLGVGGGGDIWEGGIEPLFNLISSLPTHMPTEPTKKED